MSVQVLVPVMPDLLILKLHAPWPQQTLFKYHWSKPLGGYIMLQGRLGEWVVNVTLNQDPRRSTHCMWLTCFLKFYSVIVSLDFPPFNLYWLEKLGLLFPRIPTVWIWLIETCDLLLVFSVNWGSDLEHWLESVLLERSIVMWCCAFALPHVGRSRRAFS